jgi:electron transfer flavoprotein alpha subunit
VILVIAEQREGALNRASLEAIAGAQTLGSPVKVVVAGGDVSKAAAESRPPTSPKSSRSALRRSRLHADAFVAALAALDRHENPALVVLPHTYQTRDFAPRLAAGWIDRSSPTAPPRNRTAAGCCSRGRCSRAK